MSSTIGNLLLDNNRILLIPVQGADLDAYFSTIGLAYSLLSLDKEVSIFLDDQLQQGLFKSLISESDINFIKQKDLNSLVVTLDNINAKIQEIKWEERNGKIDIFIDTDQGPEATKDLNLKLQSQSYDTCVLIGFGDPRSLGDFYEEHKSFFQADKTIIINDKAANNIFSYKHYPVFTPTISQSIFYFLKEFNLPFEDRVATNVLAGLFWGTDSFSEKLNKKTFNIASQLIENGANAKHAANLGINITSFMQAKYLSQVFAEVKTTKDDIYYSEINLKDLNGALKNNLIRNMVPIKTIKGCEIAFVGIRDNNKTDYYIASNNDQIDLLELLDEYNPKGNTQYVSFRGSIQSKDFVIKLGNLIAQYDINKDFEEETLPEKNTQEIIEKSSEPKIEAPAKEENTVKPKAETLVEQIEKTLSFEELTNEDNTEEPNNNELNELELKDNDRPKIQNNVTPEKETKNVDAKQETTQKQPEAKKEEHKTNIDPLAPATSIPEPIRLGQNSDQPKTSAAFNSPLPPAESE